MASQVPDDAFREIQLNGKQLVFLFMVATVVSVVIFLCGVFVGRGVRAERAPLAADASASTPVTTPDTVPAEAPAPTPAGSDPTAAAPPPAVDELSYFNRLEKPGQPVEDLKPATAKPSAEKPTPDKATAEKTVADRKAADQAAAPAAKSATSEKPAPAPKASDVVAKAPPASQGSALPEPPGPGFTLQIMASRERGEAETIAKRLSGKGYAAYVQMPGEGSAPLFYRVRVGKFKTRREAEVMASRLQKDEQLKDPPWITR